MQICERNLCSGCSACMAVCPKSAITMVADDEGFLRPVTDRSKCIDCGLCKKKCPANTSDKSTVSAVYAAYSKDDDVRKKSSSGGIFYTLAKAVIENEGIVFGAGFDDDMKVCHYQIDNMDELYKIMGSKYVQSDMKDTLFKISDYLKEGKQVLFSGTPCQCAGVRSLFGYNDNLILVDFVCHGVPTPRLWDKYLAENFTGVKNASFRDKKYGWEEFSMRVDSDNGTYVSSRYKDPYIRIFLANVSLRPSCHSCSWKKPNFASDITLGDFWGVSKIDPSWNDNKGISVVTVRTDKGRTLVQCLKDSCFIVETEEKNAFGSNGMYYSSTPMSIKREVFFEKLLSDVPFKEIAAEFGRPLSKGKIFKTRMKIRLKVILGTIKGRRIR